MGEVISYFGCDSEIKSVSDAAKITNVVMTGVGEGGNLFIKRVSSRR